MTPFNFYLSRVEAVVALWTSTVLKFAYRTFKSSSVKFHTVYDVYELNDGRWLVLHHDAQNVVRVATIKLNEERLSFDAQRDLRILEVEIFMPRFDRSILPTAKSSTFVICVSECSDSIRVNRTYFYELMVEEEDAQLDEAYYPYPLGRYSTTSALIHGFHMWRGRNLVFVDGAGPTAIIMHSSEDRIEHIPLQPLLGPQASVSDFSKLMTFNAIAMLLQCIQETFFYGEKLGIITNEAANRELHIYDLSTRQWTRTPWFGISSGLDFYDIDPKATNDTLYYHAVINRRRSQPQPALSAWQLESFRMEFRWGKGQKRG